MALVIADSRVSEVVHAANGTARERPGDDDTPPFNLLVDVDGDEGEEQHDDRDEEGGDRDLHGVEYLQLWLSIFKGDGAVSNKVLRVFKVSLLLLFNCEVGLNYHGPYCNALHGDGRADEEQAQKLLAKANVEFSKEVSHRLYAPRSEVRRWISSSVDPAPRTLMT